MECPRCRQPLTFVRRQSPYRSKPSDEPPLPRCHACELVLVPAEVMLARKAAPPAQVGLISVERTRRPLTESCPKCLCSLERVVVVYEPRVVEFEECPSCGLFVLDDGELRALEQLVRATEYPPEHSPASPFEEAPKRTLLGALADIFGGVKGRPRGM